MYGLFLIILLVSLGAWVSYATDLVLAAGVRNLINQIYEELERSYGAELVRAALGFITFAVQGISDDEMCDLLTLHPGVMSAVNQYNSSPTLPPHVWLRLRGDIEGLVTERAGGCVIWFHRQLQEAAVLRYVAEECSLHTTMGQYFGNLADRTKLAVVQSLVIGSDERTDTGDISRSDTKPLSVWFSDVVINKRRCVEAADHLIKAGKWILI